MKNYKIDLQGLKDRGFNGEPLEFTVKENFPTARFCWKDFYHTLFVEDGAYMTMLDSTNQGRVWLFVYQILPDEWIVQISEENDIQEKILYKQRVLKECQDEWEKAFVPAQLVLDYFEG